MPFSTLMMTMDGLGGDRDDDDQNVDPDVCLDGHCRNFDDNDGDHHHHHHRH